MKTAVEWLENQIKTSKYFYKLMEDINSRSTVAQSNIFEQAKEMEKEQLENAWYAGDEDGAIHEFEYHYNETFKKD
jgi:hypothetical protein